MANYFVIDNTFRPYSFDELVKPYQMYGEAYKQQEALLDAAREKEFSADNLDKELDKEAYDMYTKATSGLRAASDELATRGLSTRLRASIRNTARDYQSTMNALNTAQAALVAERTRRANLGPDYVFQQGDVRIGDYLGGKSANQSGQSLKTIATDIAAEFSARANTISKDTWKKALLDGKQTGYFDVTTEKGLTDAQLSTILSDQDTWDNIMRDPGISDTEKAKLQGFRDVIAAKKRAVGFDQYDSLQNKEAIEEAIFRGAHAGLGSVTHEYKKDENYNPLGWSNYNLNLRKYNDSVKEAEAPYEHKDENNPSVSNRTGKLKPGYSIVNGKLQYNDPDNPVSAGSGSSVDYRASTPGITVYYKGQENTYSSWDKVAAGQTVQKWNGTTTIPGPSNLRTVAIEDVSDPDIRRAMLSRINISTANKSDTEVAALVASHLPALKQLTVKVQGKPEDGDEYAWAIEDKIPKRDTGEGGVAEEVYEYDPNSKER